MIADADFARFSNAASCRGIELMARDVAGGHGVTRFRCRSVAQWRSALEALQFTVQAEPMSRGTPFANVLLVARTAT